MFPATREQRCWFHKQGNILSTLPKSAHPGAVAAIKDIHYAENIDKAQIAIKAFKVDYGAKYPEARQDHRRRRRAPGVRQISRRALDPFENNKSDRYLESFFDSSV